VSNKVNCRREATGRRTLDFQVAPGLALVNRQTASTLELQAARVKYVVDSDAGGRAIATVLRGGGVDDADIFELRRPRRRDDDRGLPRRQRLPLGRE
jgi:hypothetical protein